MRRSTLCLFVFATVTSLLAADVRLAQADCGKIFVYRTRRGYVWPRLAPAPRPHMYWGNQYPGGYYRPQMDGRASPPFSYSPGHVYNQNPYYHQTPHTSVNSPVHNQALLSQNTGTQISINGSGVPRPAAEQFSSMGRSVNFREAQQNAVLAWNGEEQLMVLSTDEETNIKGGAAVLSVLPLPGEPVSVLPASTDLFKDACKLIYTKAGLASRGEILLTAKIGTHNIFIWKLDSPDDFSQQVRSYIKEQYSGQADALITEEIDKVIRDYFKRGFRHFAFDLTFMGDEDATKVAIAYRFKSKFLYYPLVVSKIGSASTDTRVRLAVFTPGLLHNFSGLKADRIETVGDKSVDVSAGELKELDAGLADVMGNKDVKARIFEINGKLNAFDGDLMAH